MGGTPTNAKLWTDADVYLADDLSTPNPATITDPFGAGWKLIGLLDGDDGMPESRDEDTDDKFAWGGLLIRTSRSHFKLTKKFSALEDNPSTRSLLWPGSTDSQIIVPVPARRKIAFEVRDPGTGTIRRLISRNHVIVELDGDLDENETDLTKYTFAASVYPDVNKVLFDRQFTPNPASLAIAPATKTLAVGAIGALVATITYDDTSTAVVTSLAGWSSSATPKATVEAGYVTAVATGAATITASYLGKTATCAVTVT